MATADLALQHDRQIRSVAERAVAFVVMVVFLVIAPAFLYPVFLMKALCFALFACAFNLLHRLCRAALVRPRALFRLGELSRGAFGEGRQDQSSVLGRLLAVVRHSAPAVVAGACHPRRRALAAVLGLIAGAIAIRRQGIYFAMITLALAQMMYFFAVQAPFTGGEDGIQSVPRGRLFGLIDLADQMNMYITVLVIFLAGFLLIYRIINSPFGEVLKAIRENEARAISLGYKTDRYKLMAFVLSATFAGVAGATKAIVFQLASLTDVDWPMSGEVVLMTLVGGLGTVFGPVAGAFFVVTLENYLTQIGQWVLGRAGRDLRHLRAAVPPRHRRRARPPPAHPAMMRAAKRSNRNHLVKRETSMSAEARLKQLGITLPKVPTPVANYLPYRLAGNLLFLSGQGPRDDDGNMLTGKVGAEVSVEEAYKRARLIGLELLSATRQALGSLDRVETVLQDARHGQCGARFQGPSQGDQRLLRLVRRGARRRRQACPLGGRHGLAAQPDFGRDRGGVGGEALKTKCRCFPRRRSRRSRPGSSRRSRSCVMALSFGAPWIVVVALKSVAAEVGGSRSIPALAGSLAWFGQGLGGILMGRVADIIGVRWTVIFGAAMICAGLLLSMGGAPWQLYLGHGLFIGILGNGGINAPFYIYVSRWFDRRRGSALALISSGSYVAGAIWPNVFEPAIAHIGWRETMLWYGLLEVTLIVPLALIFLRRPPELPIGCCARCRERSCARLRLAAKCGLCAAGDRELPVLRDHVDAAGPSGGALQRPRHQAVPWRRDAVAAARRGLHQPPGVGLDLRSHRRPADCTAQLRLSGRRHDRLSAHPGRGRPVRRLGRLRAWLCRHHPGLCACNPTAFPRLRSLLADPDLAAAQRHRHGNRRLARGNSLRLFRLLRPGVRRRRCREFVELGADRSPGRAAKIRGDLRAVEVKIFSRTYSTTTKFKRHLHSRLTNTR